MVGVVGAVVLLLAGAAGLAAVGAALVVAAHGWFQLRGLGKERRRMLPPGDMGWPIIGHMWSFLRAFKSGRPDSFIGGFVKRYGRTGIYKSFMFGSPTILLTTPETCKQVLMDDEHFVPGWPKATRKLVGEKSFVSISPEEHKWLRRLTSAPVNGFEALSTYLRFIEDVVVESLDKWAAMDEIEFLTELRRFTFRIIMYIFFSSVSHELMEKLEAVYTDLNYGMRAMAINVPGFAYHRALKARKKLVAILQSVLNERRSRRYQGVASASKDMMDALITAEDDKGRKLDDEQIIDILIMYLNAGHESSAHVTMWTTLFLDQHPEILQKAKEEQEEIRRNLPSSQTRLTLKDVKKMQYASKIIDESLRVVNISFVSFREATSDVQINGYIVPKGWKVQLWYRSVHMDPEVYRNHKEFDPSRWDGPVPKAGTFLPFGGGSRLCPGNDLAKLEILVFLHHFLLKYRLERFNPQSPIRYLPHPRPIDNCKAKIMRTSAPVA